MKLKELEKRLDKEPTNLGLRVQVAGLMREAGRSVEAVELYRSVALAYRDQGRNQQAIAVCRSILELAPEDAGCQGLLATLAGPAPAPAPARTTSAEPPPEPQRRSSLDETPLPRPVPHHVVDPTSQQYKLSSGNISSPITPSQGVVATEMDLSAELDTRQRPKLTTDQVAKLDEVTIPGARDSRPSAPGRDSPAPRLTPIPIARDSDSDLLTQPREALPPRTSDDELTTPHDRPKLFDEDDD